MEIFEPQNFFNMASVLAGIFTGILAIAGLIIAYKTFLIAREAKNEWKRQKFFEIEVELSSKIGEAMYLLIN